MTPVLKFGILKELVMVSLQIGLEIQTYMVDGTMVDIQLYVRNLPILNILYKILYALLAQK